jgi:hypothetical protein
MSKLNKSSKQNPLDVLAFHKLDKKKLIDKYLDNKINSLEIEK